MASVTLAASGEKPMPMNLRHSISLLFLLLAASIFNHGCAGGPPVVPVDITGVDSAIIQAPFAETWQATKQALQNKEFTIFTRDKRGIFVAYLDIERRRFRRYRTEYVVVLEPLTTNSTRVTVEATHQRFEVTFLTHPAWRNIDDGPGFESMDLLAAVAEQAQQNRAAKSAESAD